MRDVSRALSRNQKSWFYQVSKLIFIIDEMNKVEIPRRRIGSRSCEGLTCPIAPTSRWPAAAQFDFTNELNFNIL